MFDRCRAEVGSRLGTARDLLQLAHDGGREHTGSSACRGLIFVHLYGLYEYSLHESVRIALRAIGEANGSASQTRLSVLSLVLHSKFCSAADAGRARLWDRRLELLDSITSETPLAPDDSRFPGDGSHYRVGQVETIWKIFGIAGEPVPHPRLIGRIDELVSKRNAIAHGRETAHEVGRRFSPDEMATRIVDTDLIATHILDLMEQRLATGGLGR